MRALCGAIISAGALIGLGLVSMGIGTRYQGVTYREAEPIYVRFRDLDTALLIALVTVLIGLIIGLGIAFLGLAYHHHRRHLEMHRTMPPAPGTHSPAERITVWLLCGRPHNNHNVVELIMWRLDSLPGFHAGNINLEAT